MARGQRGRTPLREKPPAAELSADQPVRTGSAVRPSKETSGAGGTAWSTRGR